MIQIFLEKWVQNKCLRRPKRCSNFQIHNFLRKVQQQYILQ